MSKISIEFDTVEKTMKVTKDGAEMSDVCYISIGKSYSEAGKFSISVESEQINTEDKTATRTTVYASESAQSEFAAAVAAYYGV